MSPAWTTGCADALSEVTSDDLCTPPSPFPHPTKERKKKKKTPKSVLPFYAFYGFVSARGSRKADVKRLDRKKGFYVV